MFLQRAFSVGIWIYVAVVLLSHVDKYYLELYFLF